MEATRGDPEGLVQAELVCSYRRVSNLLAGGFALCAVGGVAGAIAGGPSAPMACLIAALLAPGSVLVHIWGRNSRIVIRDGQMTSTNWLGKVDFRARLDEILPGSFQRVDMGKGYGYGVRTRDCAVSWSPAISSLGELHGLMERVANTQQGGG